MFRYRLHSPDGDDLGEATYAMMIKPDEEIIAGNNQRFRVLDVVPFEEEDESPFVRAATGRADLAERPLNLRQCRDLYGRRARREFNLDAPTVVRVSPGLI
jgi:hypothetical protein